MARGCVKQTQAKYVGRPSPPFPANECCDQIMTGNDGLKYISKRASNGICRWVRYHGSSGSSSSNDKPKKSDSLKNKSAKKIQSVYRGYRSRKAFKQLLKQRSSRIVIIDLTDEPKKKSKKVSDAIKKAKRSGNYIDLS